MSLPPMSLLAVVLAIGFAQQKPAPDVPAQQMPPEEDASLKPPVYAFNPLQATKEVKVGDYYMKRKDFKGAMNRYLEATHWNPQMGEAWRKLGEADEKLDEAKGAREAYQKFLEIEPDSKAAAEVKKRLEKLPSS